MAYHEDIVTDSSGKPKCALCKIFIPDSDNFIENHLHDKDHAKLFMKRLMTQNNIITKDGRMGCGICEEVADLMKVIDHIQSPRHKENMDSITNIIIKDGGFLVIPDAITNLDSTVKCLICNRLIEFNLNAIKSHIASERHKRARSIAVQPLNAIFSVEDSEDDLWCKICQVYFQNYVEIINEHVDEDPRHVKEINKIFLLIKDQQIDVEKFFHDPKEDKALCKKCQVEVPCNLDNLGRHIGGKKHKS